MSVTAVRETWNSRRGNSTDQVAEYERVFKVFTSSTLDGALTVLAAPGLPKVLDAYADANGAVDPFAYCNRVEPLQDQDDPTTWLVRCYYTTDITQSPWLAPPEVSWTFEKYQRVVFQSYDVAFLDPGPPPQTLYAAIANTAYELFDPPPAIDDSRAVLTVKRNQLVFEPSLAVAYQDAVNSDSFYGVDPGLAKVDSISASSKKLSSLTYWEVTYVIHFRREGWRLKVLDAGFKELFDPGAGAALVQRIIRDPTGAPISTPWPLNGAGKKVAFTNTKNINQQLTWLFFTVYKALPFAPLGLQ